MIAHRRPPGDPFAAWLDRWTLLPDGVPILTFGCSLLPVRHGDTPAMLKIAHESEERLGAELMVWWNGRGAAPVLAHEGEALLMERAMGTRSLDDLSRSGAVGDDEACRTLCEAIALLHAPRPETPPALIPLETWFAPLLDGHGRYDGITTVCAETARALFTERREPAVLHGDVHHGNVLDFGERGWLAIDPKGLHGDRAFDYANLFRNGDIDTTGRPGERFARRLDMVSAAAGLERQRILHWTMAFAGLSSVWLRDDGDNADDDLFIATLCLSASGYA